MAILDSGARRVFETGATRDIQEGAGKGRCDLMPLDVVAEFVESSVLASIAAFKEDGSIESLYGALQAFEYELKVSGCTLLLEVAKHFEEGAKKYGEYNWQKGIPVHCYIDSAVRHYLKWMRRDEDEPHARAFIWNILCCVWTCKHIPALNDFSIKVEKC